MCYLIWPCDISVCITYLISHSSSLSYNLKIFQFRCIINTKLPSSFDIIRSTSLGFPSWCPESIQYIYVNIFIIHPCDPTVVMCYLIWPCDISVCITYLISHSSSLSYNLKIFQFRCIINTKLPSSFDIIRSTSLGFPSWCPESTRPTNSCFQVTSYENLVMYGGLYQHTRVVLYIYHIPSI